MEEKKRAGRPKGSFKSGARRIKANFLLKQENLDWLRKHKPISDFLDKLIDEQRGMESEKNSNGDNPAQ